MCGMSSFAFTFIYEALVKRKAFSVTERLMFAFFQKVGIEIQCMQCLRSKLKGLSVCVPLEYALGICCFSYFSV